MGNKICNKCQTKELGWDMEYNKKTGKWKLDDHRRQDGKWCNKLSKQSQEIKIKKNDIEKCKLCKGNSGWILTEQGRSRLVDRHSPTMEEHLKTYHPNNEVLDDIDIMVIFNDQKEQLRIYRNNRGVNYE
tara:strand:+ start:1003 stop:1392 length:390 start_codon:yes stop_codon:yes gene_type:complete